MQKLYNIEMIRGGKVEPVFCGEIFPEPKRIDGLFAITDNKFNGVVVAYIVGYEQAVNYDRAYNYGLGPQYVIGSDGKYHESDCYETIGPESGIVYKK